MKLKDFPEITNWVVPVKLPRPSLQDNTSDADRLRNHLVRKFRLAHLRIDLPLLKKLPDRLRSWDFSLKCILFRDRASWILAGILPPDDTLTAAGIAIDLGTTRIALKLVDLETGRPLGESHFTNPQTSVGPDVLERIHYADEPGGLKKLNRLLVAGLNHHIDLLCEKQDIPTENIFLVSAAGNTTMSHLFLGLTPHAIIREPYIPAVNAPDVFTAAELGLNISETARVLVFPNIGSYFGGDLIAGILHTEMHRTEENRILVDVGTNAEVVAGNRNWLIACAGAAGPALEGGVTRMGMMAGPGVVDSVNIEPDTGVIHFSTIAGLEPKGICGSGVIDLAAELFLSGMIDIRGKLVPDRCGSHLKNIDGINHFVLVPEEKSASGADLTVSQADLDSLVRSKAAMYTILETLLTTVGITFQDLTTFYVAGTFGSFIKPESAITIGMIPDLPGGRFKALGNSSLEGALKILSTPAAFDEIYVIRDRITYIELNVNQEFMNRFSAAKFIPHTDVSRFPSVKRN